MFDNICHLLGIVILVPKFSKHKVTKQWTAIKTQQRQRNKAICTYVVVSKFQRMYLWRNRTCEWKGNNRNSFLLPLISRPAFETFFLLLLLLFIVVVWHCCCNCCCCCYYGNRHGLFTQSTYTKLTTFSFRICIQSFSLHCH